ncbi:hypothetical protein SteCoe_22376 [Stentor coeruleus]|uniref:Uncharacterized protein n=1 Tax=Stentor coeruleus TaxID=5963 RepID=A0A1R2BMC0_9CILI|nr:hypothetical protein SteCoe_22376 [Stentor coeruleus]
MNPLSIWLGFHTFSKTNLNETRKIVSFFLSSDWGISETSSGSLFIFKLPLQSPQKLLNITAKVLSISCNHTMVLILTTIGDIWLWGDDPNKFGLFGQNNLYSSHTAIKIPSFSTSNIIQASLSEHHAGALCQEGFLYTWGTGYNGELCSDLTFSPEPQVVDNSTIFNISQVLCGENYTAICTTGGFMYIYATKHDFLYAHQSNQPFVIEDLQDFYIEKLYDSKFGIVIITDEGKGFLLENTTKRIIGLPCSKKIHMVATCLKGIVGVPIDKKKMYIWTKENNQWNPLVFKLGSGMISQIHSGKGDNIYVIGYNLEDMENGVLYGESPETTPLKVREKEKIEFDEIFSKFKTSLVGSGLNMKKEACGGIIKVLSGSLCSAFADIRNYVLVKAMFDKAYASSFTPSYIEKAIQRVIVINKSFAFQCVKSFTKYHYLTDPKLRNNVRAIKSLAPKLFRILSKIVFKKIVGDKYRKRSAFVKRKGRIAELLQKATKRYRRKPFSKIMFRGNRDAFRKSAATKLKFSAFGRKFDLYFDVLINKSLINQRKLSFIRINAFSSLKFEQALQRSFKRWLKALTLWKNTKVINNLKKNAAILIFSELQSLVKTRYHSLILLLKPRKSVFEIKFGAFLLFSTIGKAINKSMIQSFNAIQRYRYHSSLESMIDILKIAIHRSIIASFHSIKIYSISHYNNKIVKFALFAQSYSEKNLYRQKLKGFNSFKITYFNRSMFSEVTMEKSFRSQPGCGLLSTPPSSPGPDFSITSDVLQKSMIVKSCSNKIIERKPSLTSMQKNMVMKISEKMSNESKSSQVLPQAKPKGKIPSKPTLPDKKVPMSDLKEKAKKSLPKTKDQPLIQRKRSETFPKETPKTVVKSILKDSERKSLRYRNSLEKLKNTLQKFLKSRLLNVFLSFKLFKTLKNSKFLITLNNARAIGTQPPTEQPSPRTSIKALSIASKSSQKTESTVPDLTPVQTSAAATWKSKLISLGLNKILRILTIHDKKLVFKRLIIKKY